MDPLIPPAPHISNDKQRASSILPRAEAITPTKSSSRSLFADLAASSSRSDVRAQAPGSEHGGGQHQPGNLARSLKHGDERSSGQSHAAGGFQKSSHLPTPQSPGNVVSYLLTRTPSLKQSLQADLESNALPTEFRSHASPSPPPFRTHSIPTPDSSPLVARSRSHGSRILSQCARANSEDDNESLTPGKKDGSRSRASTPPRTPSRQTSTRPMTPMLQSHPTTPSQRKTVELLSSTSPHLGPHNAVTGPVLQRIKDEPGVETAHICDQLTESHLTSTQAAESSRPDYLKRMQPLVPSSSAGAELSLASDLGSHDGSLPWSPSVSVVQSPAKGKRIALFQETSEESFEESLMAGGYGRYRSDKAWKLDGDVEVSNQLGDAIGEEGLAVSALVLTEEEKRKKTRLAAFLDPPRVASAARLFPVEVEGCGRVLMKVESSEPQTLPKPSPKTKRSRKRKKAPTDMKQDVDKDSVTTAEDGGVDGPNWPDTEFPWRSRLMAQDGLSSAERAERRRHIESFLDRDSDEDDAETGHSLSSRRNLVGTSSRSFRPGRGKTFPLLSHFQGHRRGMATISGVPSDPADARTTLLSKKSIRAVQLRLLRRRRDTDRGADNDNGEVLCVCRGRDDGRPLVQCDACRTWYHLDCIGIQSTSELGREEDPWFCGNCAEVKTPPPVAVSSSEPTLVRTDSDEHGVGEREGAGTEGYDPPFLNAGLHPSPVTTWTRATKAPTTPPRTQHVGQNASGSSWDEPPSSSSRGDPHTPQFNAASAFGDMVRVYGTTPGRSLEGTTTTVVEESPFDPTSTPSRGIRFGLPFTTPKDGRWGSSFWQGVRGSGHELFHTPKHPGEDGGVGSWKYGQPFLQQDRVGEVSEEGSSGVSGSYRTSGPNNVTPIERDGTGGVKRMQALESPLGAKRSKRAVSDSLMRP